jgi:predicted hydrocarbon binding protein
MQMKQFSQPLPPRHHPDQRALRGFLTQLWNPNFTMVSVEEIGNGDHQNSRHWNLL